MFEQQMQKLGYVHGTNIHFDTRNAEGQLERIPALIEQLVERRASAGQADRIG